MIRVLSVFGTRPEAIKMLPLVRKLGAHPDTFDSRVCVTGQHREMLDQVLALYGEAPDYDLDLMRANQALSDVTSAILERLSPVIRQVDPSWVVVQGDTTTSFAASLAAFYRRIPVAHVEAGLRTNDIGTPFPEEANRRLTSILADTHLAPTKWAAENLLHEGIASNRIFVTGNTVVDAIRTVSDLPFDPSPAESDLLALPPGPVVLVTCHRRENHGPPLARVLGALRGSAQAHPETCFALPVHPNPAVQEPVRRYLKGIDNVRLLPPLRYRAFIWLMQRSRFLITDSGGLQEEAIGLGKPVLVLRETTERPEGVLAGTAKLVGTNGRLLEAWIDRLLADSNEYEHMSNADSPYGDGDAADKIAEILYLRSGLPERRQSRRRSPVPVAALPQTRLPVSVGVTS